MNDFNFRVPGESDGPVYSDKQICVHADYSIMDRIAVTIAANAGDLDKGTVIGVTTADSLYRQTRRYPIKAAAISGATDVKVATGANIKQGDTVSVMKADGTGVESGGAVSSVVDNGDGTTTINFPTATAEALAANDLIYVSDGSEKALLILGDVALNAAQDQVCNAFMAGKFYLSKLVGADAFAQKDLGARVIQFGVDQVTGDDESILIV